MCWLVVIFLCVGCQNHRNPADHGLLKTYEGDGPIEVVGTVGMVCDLVREVGGQRVHITQIIGSGLDPHSFVPTSADVKLIKNADIVFYNGLMLEGKMAEVFKSVGRSKPVVPVAELLDRKSLASAGATDAAAASSDPHLWMDVSAWSSCAAVVADRLSAFDPDHATTYQENLSKLQATLDDLHQYAIEVLGTIPRDRRVLVTSHDAFNYFGRAYGLEVMGVQGISTESEAGVQRINELVDVLVAKQVRAVFTESSVDASMIQALIEGARNRGHAVKSGKQLFSDAMGAQGTYRGTYVGMLDHNITTVAIELGGQADPGGFQGKLIEGNPDPMHNAKEPSP
jgi:manganese/zinc/iron transport system substrate-binding protein